MNSKIKINVATKDILMTLPGIGEKIAERILLHREHVGYFEGPEDLKKIKGIGTKFLKTNLSLLDFELPLEEKISRKREELMEEYVNPLTGVFIKGEQSGDRHAARQAMNKLKENYLQEHSEGWELVVEWATTEFKAHKEEENMNVLDENLMPISDDELLEEAGKSANLWLKVKGGGSSSLDKDSQQYVEILEELLYLQHKLDEEVGLGRSPEENDRLLKEEERLSLKLQALEIKILEGYQEREEGRASSLNEFLEIIREKPISAGEAYIARLRIATEEQVMVEIRQDEETWREEDDPSSPSINLENYDEVNEAFWEEALIERPQLRWLSRPAKGWKRGGFEASPLSRREDNRMHNMWMKQKGEALMTDILARREREHGIAAHGQYLEDGKMKVYIFPETEDLLSKYRARIKVLANSLNDEDYEAKLKEARAVMARLFQNSQERARLRFKAEFVQALKKDLNELRTIFFMPYDRAQLKEAQQEHVEQGKPMKWIPKFCKKDLQLKLEFRNKEGKLVSKAGSPLAFLNKESLIILYNDGVARLLALGVEESELPNFSGSPFLKTYEQHMAAQGKEAEARAMIKARAARDEVLEEVKFLASLNKGSKVRRGDQNIVKVFDDDDEEIGLDFLDEQASPEEQVMFLEIWED